MEKTTGKVDERQGRWMSVGWGGEGGNLAFGESDSESPLFGVATDRQLAWPILGPTHH